MVVLVFIVFVPPLASAQVKKWVDEKGVVHIEAEGPYVDRTTPDEPPDEGADKGPLIIEPKPGPPLVLRPDYPPRRGPAARRSPKLRLVFGKRTDFIEGNYHHIQGVVKNPSRATARWVQVKAKIFGRHGRLLRIEETYADPYHIPPRGESTFHLMFPADPESKRYEIAIYSRE